MAAALVLMIGLVLDGGLTLAARERALGEAQEAARAGAQAVNLATYRQDGNLVLDPAQAEADARRLPGQHRRHRHRDRHGGPGHRHGDHRPADADPVRRRAARGHRPRDRLRRARAGHRRAAAVRRALTRAWRLLRALAGIAVDRGAAGGPALGPGQATTGSPLPRTWPGWQQAQRFFASPLTDDAIIRFLADAAWLLWAVFALSLADRADRGDPGPARAEAARDRAGPGAGRRPGRRDHDDRAARPARRRRAAPRRCTPRSPPPRPSPPRSCRAAPRSWTQPPNPPPALRAATARPRPGRGSTGSRRTTTCGTSPSGSSATPRTGTRSTSSTRGNPSPTAEPSPTRTSSSPAGCC